MSTGKWSNGACSITPTTNVFKKRRKKEPDTTIYASIIPNQRV